MRFRIFNSVTDQEFLQAQYILKTYPTSTVLPVWTVLLIYRSAIMMSSFVISVQSGSTWRELEISDKCLYKHVWIQFSIHTFYLLWCDFCQKERSMPACLRKCLSWFSQYLVYLFVESDVQELSPEVHGCWQKMLTYIAVDHTCGLMQLSHTLSLVE